MKKVLRSISGAVLGLALLIAFMFMQAGTVGNSVGNTARAEEEHNLYALELDFSSSVFEIERATYYVDGIQITYFADGYTTLDGIRYYHIYYNGTSGELELMEGEARTEYSLEEPFAEEIKALGFGRVGINDKVLVVDKGSDVMVHLRPASDGIEKHYYMSEFSYKIGATGSYYLIDRASLSTYGGYDFTGTHDEDRGCYTQTINTNYTFNYFYAGNEFWVEVVDMKADMTIKFSTSQRVVGITTLGSGADLLTSNQTYYSYSDIVEIKVTPQDGRMVKMLQFKLDQTVLITLYGGLQSGGNAVFPDGETHAKTITYGNFILGYESDYDFQVVDSKANYAELKVVKDVGEPYLDLETFSITLKDNGQITFKSNKVYQWMKFDIEAQKYAQVNLINVVDSDNQVSSLPFSQVQIGEGEDAVIYDSNIPSRIFALDFDDSIYVKAVLANTYNFTERMDPIYIEDNYFIDEKFEGGVLSIYAQKEDTVTFTIRLFYQGSQFSNSDTKIYISNRGISSVEEFNAVTELATTSSAGIATKRGVDRNTNVQIYIQISPYFVMYVDGNYYARNYTNFEFLVTKNQTLEIDIDKFYMARPVMYDGEEIGTLEISLDQVTISLDAGGNLVHNAVYHAKFKNKGADAFAVITKTNPSIYGYNLVNMVVDGSFELLTYYADGTFGIDPTNETLHEFLASAVFYVPDNSKQIIATFTSKLNSFYFYNGMDYYEGEAYYGESEIFIDTEVVIDGRGMYFGGLSCHTGDDVIELFTVEAFDPEYMTEGEFAGMYKYKLTSPWSIDDLFATYEPLILYRTYNVEFVITSSPTDNQSVTGQVKYNSTFSISQINSEELPAPAYGTGYNLIGWAMVTDTDVFFVIADDCDFLFNEEITYTWIEDVRFVPVFSQSIATVTIYDPNGDYVDSILVRYDQEIEDSLFELLTNDEGEYYIFYKFGYTYLGFYDNAVMADGKKVIAFSYSAAPNYYAPICDENLDYFTFTDGSWRWALLGNLDLYGTYDAVLYDLDLMITNSSMLGQQISFNTGQTEVLAQDHYYLQSFDITDTIIISGLNPNATSYIAKITIGYTLAGYTPGGEETVMGEDSFYALCARNGEVTGFDVDGRFNIDNHTLTIVVADFINATTNADNIYVIIEYLPVTYIVSFTASIVDSDGQAIVPDSASIVYYKFTIENAYISRVAYWQECDENGVTTGRKGWWPITLPASKLYFTSASLYGISGLSYTAPNGKVYSFKEWRDIDDGISLANGVRIDGEYDFISVFSDAYDVTIKYYTYDELLNDYILHFETGYFWIYDDAPSEYHIDNAYTANTYEINLIKGSLHYIAYWTQSTLSTFTTIENAGIVRVPLMSEIYLEYSSEAYEVCYYAVYAEFNYSLDSSTGNYVVSANLPNDPMGNSYSESDVKWVKVLKSEFNSSDLIDLNQVDRLTYIFSYGEGIVPATIATGSALSKSVSIGSDYYLFAVIERKSLEAFDKTVLYMAIKVF